MPLALEVGEQALEVVRGHVLDHVDAPDGEERPDLAAGVCKCQNKEVVSMYEYVAMQLV